MKESMKAFEEYKKDNPDAYYTAEWSLGYALTHHPWFILEIIVIAVLIAVGVCVFA